LIVIVDTPAAPPKIVFTGLATLTVALAAFPGGSDALQRGRDLRPR